MAQTVCRKLPDRALVVAALEGRKEIMTSHELTSQSCLSARRPLRTPLRWAFLAFVSNIGCGSSGGADGSGAEGPSQNGAGGGFGSGGMTLFAGGTSFGA